MHRTLWTLRVALALSVLLVWPSAVRSQDRLVVSPKAVATEFLNALTAGDWPTVIRLTDEQSLWEHATHLRSTYRGWRENTRERPTVDMYMKGDSLMPQVVAEYLLSRDERLIRNPVSTLLWILADVERPAQLDSLTDGELFIRQLRARQLGYQLALGNKLMGCVDQPASALLPEPVRHVRGVALVSETEAVSLYTEETGMPEGRSFGGGYSQLELRRGKLGWRIVASDALIGSGIMGMAVSGEGCTKASPPR